MIAAGAWAHCTGLSSVCGPRLAAAHGALFETFGDCATAAYRGRETLEAPRSAKRAPSESAPGSSMVRRSQARSVRPDAARF